MTDQEIVDQFARCIIGMAALPAGDPRTPSVAIASIALNQFVAMTRYAAENGLLEAPPTNGFEPEFHRKIKDNPQA